MKADKFSPLNQAYFEDCANLVLKEGGENVFLSWMAEDTQFVRFNDARVRQTGEVRNAALEIQLRQKRGSVGFVRSQISVNIQGDPAIDRERLLAALSELKRQADGFAIDPYAEPAENLGSGTQETPGIGIPDRAQVLSELLPAMSGLDLTGIWAAGPIARGFANSAGQRCWFKSDTYSMDYSCYTPSKRAVRGNYAGRKWDTGQFRGQMLAARERMPLLERPSKTLERGTYRVYLAPSALNEIISMFSWYGVSEGSIRQNQSPLARVRRGEERFSPLFTLTEDFREGLLPRFSSEGDLAPERIELIGDGILKNALISRRTAKEYGVPSNGAEGSERLRSPVVGPGDLDESQILSKLDRGIWISNLHYLNWSNQVMGRITGMTRFACFWVEGGKWVAPIENLRFDDSLFSLLGPENLAHLTKHSQVHPDVHTYEWRSLGGSTTPGALIENMNFTL